MLRTKIFTKKYIRTSFDGPKKINVAKAGLMILVKIGDRIYKKKNYLT